MDDNNRQINEDEVAIALKTLIENRVEPTEEIKEALDEVFELQIVHDLLCNELDRLKESSGKMIIDFFLAWKWNNHEL